MGIFKKEEKEKNQGVQSDIEELKETVLNAGMPENVKKIALKEIEKLVKTAPSSAEYTIGTNYLHYLNALPWNIHTEDNLDIGRAENILEEDHFGLSEIKNRILEHLAVRILKMSKKHRILVVDDEKPARQNLEYVFVKEGLEVVTAESGAEALKALEMYEFDAVVTDLKMEKIDGMDVLHAAKQKKSGN